MILTESSDVVNDKGKEQGREHVREQEREQEREHVSEKGRNSYNIQGKIPIDYNDIHRRNNTDRYEENGGIRGIRKVVEVEEGIITGKGKGIMIDSDINQNQEKVNRRKEERTKENERRNEKKQS